MTELYEPTRWSLQDLLSATSGAEFDQIVADLDGKVTELEGWREYGSGKLLAGWV